MSGLVRVHATRPAVTQRWAATLARLVLGVVWLVAGLSKIGAGLSKIGDLDASVRAVRAYRLLPELAAQVVGAALPLAEVLLGVLLVAGLFVRASAVLSALLMAAFVAGIASAWGRGLRIDCGCFGSGGELAAGAEPAYGWELARDGGLLLLALLLARWPAGYYALDGLLSRGRKEDDRCHPHARPDGLPGGVARRPGEGPPQR